MNNVFAKCRVCVKAQFRNTFKNKLYRAESKKTYLKSIRVITGLRNIEMFIFYLITRR